MTQARLVRLLTFAALALTVAAAIATQSACADEAEAVAIEAPVDAGTDADDLHLDDGIIHLDAASEAGLAKQKSDSSCAVGAVGQVGQGSPPPFTVIGLTALALLFVTRRRR